MNRQEIINTVTAAQQGDNKAIDLLFREFNQKVYYTAMLTVKNEELAMDITQETFITVIKKINELETPEAFPSWLKKVCHSKCSDYYKKKEVVHETTISTDGDDDYDVFASIEDDDTDFIPDQALLKDDLKKIILDIINQLPEAQRTAIFMRYYEEMSVKEIAEIQAVSEGTVMSRLNYGRKAIAQAIEEYEKKNKIKLHAIPIFPFFHWIFGTATSQVPTSVIISVSAAITQATGVAIATGGGAAAAAGGIGLAAKIAAIPLVVKIAVPTAIAIAVAAPVTVHTVKKHNQEITTTTTITETTTIPTTLTTEETTEESTEETSSTEYAYSDTTTPTYSNSSTNYAYTTDTVATTTSQAAEKQTTAPSTATAAPTQAPQTAAPTQPENDNDGFDVYDDPQDYIEDGDSYDDDSGSSPGLVIDGTTAAN